MEHYANLGGISGVNEYEVGSDFIRVVFKDGSVYLYTYSSAGSQAIEHMKKLARQGHGLNSYISTTVRKAYAKKER